MKSLMMFYVCLWAPPFYRLKLTIKLSNYDRFKIFCLMLWGDLVKFKTLSLQYLCRYVFCSKPTFVLFLRIILTIILSYVCVCNNITLYVYSVQLAQWLTHRTPGIRFLCLPTDLVLYLQNIFLWLLWDLSLRV